MLNELGRRDEALRVLETARPLARDFQLEQLNRRKQEFEAQTKSEVDWKAVNKQLCGIGRERHTESAQQEFAKRDSLESDKKPAELMVMPAGDDNKKSSLEFLKSLKFRNIRLNKAKYREGERMIVGAELVNSTPQVQRYNLRDLAANLQPTIQQWIERTDGDESGDIPKIAKSVGRVGRKYAAGGFQASFPPQCAPGGLAGQITTQVQTAVPAGAYRITIQVKSGDDVIDSGTVDVKVQEGDRPFTGFLVPTTSLSDARNKALTT